jgi:ribosomal protein L11 methyltransferase
VTGYLPKNDLRHQRLAILKRQLERLASVHRIQNDVYCRDVAEKDWAESWKAFFKPERICANVVVKPPWAQYPARPGDLIIDIDPGMAFGTGTHATTAMCIRAIHQHLKPGHTLLDVGTGSGILLIAAALSGADRLWGIDSDEVAIHVARQNLVRNRIPTDKVTLHCGNLVAGVDETFDFVVANILSDVIIRLMDDLEKVLKYDGYFICSGIFEDRKDMIEKKMRKKQLKTLQVCAQEQWLCIVARKTRLEE